MQTKEEKVKQLGDLLGDSKLADTVLKQAEATEKQAQERGLKYKATDEPPATEETPAVEQKEPAVTETKQDTMTMEECIAACQKCVAACQECMTACQAMITANQGEMKDHTSKEASIVASITALDSALKETRKIVDTLNSDLPKGVKRHLASESPGTVAPDGKYKGLETPAVNPLGDIFNWLAQPTATPPAVQSSPEK